MQADKIHDVLVIGGGLVGASLACALDGSGLDVALVEAEPPRAVAAPDRDGRNLALAAASLNALEALGVLRHLAAKPAPIRRIHVSRRGDFGAVRMDATEHGREQFGGVVPAHDLGNALEARLGELAHLTRYAQTRLVGLNETVADEGVREVVIENQGQQHTLRTRLLVGADGTASSVRGLLGIACDEHDYAQTLFVSRVRAARGADGTAWERFTESGPLALLPLAWGPTSSGEYGCICCVPRADAEEVAALDDAGYLAMLQERFGWRVGRFLEVGKRFAYPLRMLAARELIASRAVLLGNAAQTLHPLGAQGFNLGLRDALTLAELVDEAHALNADIGADSLLETYTERRREDRAATIRFSDGLARITANPSLPLAMLRSLAFTALDALPGLRAPIVGAAMGFHAGGPRLARDSVVGDSNREALR
jgi:2-octaprenyl-6-methoxyphenol hydroxylase